MVIKSQQYPIFKYFIIICLYLTWLTEQISVDVQIIPLTLQNMKEVTNCYAIDPLRCNNDEPWVYLFYNSTNHRQQSTFQHLIPAYIRELVYLKEFSKGQAFALPKSGIIDCYYSSNLCRSVCEEDLPLVIFKDPIFGKPIRYKGYVTLSGLMSFIKTHDPATSYLAQFYHSSGQYIESPVGLTHKQIKKNANKWMKRMGSLVQNSIAIYHEKAKGNHSLNKTDPANEDIGLKIAQQYEKIQINEIQNDTVYDIDKTSQAYGYYNEIKEEQQQKKQKKASKKTQKPKKSEEQSEIKKKNRQFFQFVQKVSGAITSSFENVGFSGFALDIISWIAYIICFCIFGILFIIAA